MPDHRKHRGPHPQDAELFGPETWILLREAVGHLSWLLSKKYPPNSSLKLVGDRFQLNQRQRTAVLRCSCADGSLEERLERQITVEELAGRELHLDGFNVLTSIEAALAGGVILCGREGCCRDMASMHGNYRTVEETRPALELIGEVLRSLKTGHCCWYLDRPVSNSGRLRSVILELATQNHWPWSVELVDDPDRILVKSRAMVASADSQVLDQCGSWFNLAREIIQRKIPDVYLVDCS